MSVRRISVDVLQQVLENKIFLNTLKNQFEAKDISFANMLLLQTLRHLNALQKIINSFLRKPFAAKQKGLNFVLLCGAAEILLLETPDYAAINEYVSIAKKKNDRFAAGMVNAILRNIAKDRKKYALQVKENLFPESFKEILRQDYDKQTVNHCEEMLEVIPPLDLSIKSAPQKWAEKLGGILFENGTVRLTGLKTKVAYLEGYNEGQWWVQDLAASLPVRLLDDVKDLKVLDLCAAPGGKTAQLLSAGAKVTAVDVDAARMKKLQENIVRLQLADNLQTYVADGVEFLEQSEDYFDVIVLDVPCSATGTYRRHPEVLHLKNIEDVQKQLSIQRKLLQTSVRHLKENGKILYCTCSLAKAEGEKQIEKFLEEHSDFEIVRNNETCLKVCNGINLEANMLNKGVLRTLPYNMEQYGGTDAFFAVCLQRKKL